MTETIEKTQTTRKPLNPAVVMTIIVAIAGFLTYVLPAGRFARDGDLVVPGSYEQVPKSFGFWNIFTGTGSETAAAPVSLVQLLAAIPEGIVEQADLIFMVLFIGGMFGVLQRSGAIEAGLERALSLTRGNIMLLAPVLMIVFSFGSTFLGMAKEYLLVIPMVVAMTDRLGISRVAGLAIVAIPVKVGYLASITNPYALSVAQPLVGVPIFSGMWLRVVTYIVMMAIGIAFVLWKIRRERAGQPPADYEFDVTPLSQRHTLILITLAAGIAFMVFGSQHWDWSTIHLSAYYLFLAIVFAAEAKLGPSLMAESFVTGMKKVMIAAVLIGMATAVALVLKQGQVLDSIVAGMVAAIGQHGPYVSAYGMLISQLGLDLAIPSTSGQAAVSMPILGPVGQLAGVSSQTTVFAFLMGNGLTNIITPTSSGLLIFLATAEVGWVRWAKFVWPLVAILIVVAAALLSIAVAVGY